MQNLVNILHSKVNIQMYYIIVQGQDGIYGIYISFLSYRICNCVKFCGNLAQVRGIWHTASNMFMNNTYTVSSVEVKTSFPFNVGAV